MSEAIKRSPGRRVFADHESAAAAAAAEIVAAIREQPDLVLCFPTGNTPLAVYRRLAAARAAGEARFDAATILMVDEYVGLGPDDAGSFAGYIRDNVVARLGFDLARVHLLDGKAADATAEAVRYAALIETLGGIDLLMLGVGRNGHLGFNEPGSALDSHVHVVALSAGTLEDNAADLAGSPVRPTHAITIGLAEILAARRVILIASGARKAEPMRQLFACGDPVSWPVAALCEHRNVVALLDQAAAGGAA